MPYNGKQKFSYPYFSNADELEEYQAHGGYPINGECINIFLPSTPNDPKGHWENSLTNVAEPPTLFLWD